MTKKKGIFDVNINNPFMSTKQETKKRKLYYLQLFVKWKLGEVEKGLFKIIRRLFTISFVIQELFTYKTLQVNPFISG